MSSDTKREGEERKKPITALVLSGGGARGAYEIGVLAGMIEVLGLEREDPAPFQILSGTSVGSINSGWIAAFQDHGDLNSARLQQEWLDIDIEHFLQVEPANLMFSAFARDEHGSRSLLNPAPFEEHASRVPWDRVQHNLEHGDLHALIFTSLELDTGRTVWFTQLGHDHVFPNWVDHRRTVKQVTIGMEHMLASSAIPFTLPARRIGDHYYSDGGARFKTPIAAAIRAGAERLVVITLRNPEPPDRFDRPSPEKSSPPPLTMMTQLFGALSFDTSPYDIKRLARINELVDTLQQELSPEQLARVEDAVARERGAPWRKIPSLCFEPTFDFGELALETLPKLHHRLNWRQRSLTQLLELSKQAGALSFLLFDRLFTEALIERGKRDAHARAEEIRDFFAE